jgi:hypothetical protein
VVWFEIPQGWRHESACGKLGHEKPQLTDLGWLGPKDEMDRASHRFGKCSGAMKSFALKSPRLRRRIRN